MKQANQQKGFTIIEVVLVLAIAALIFLVVFLAVPALQRSQRDTQRRSDLGRFHTAIVNWAGNRQGQIPLPTGGAADPKVVNNNWVQKYVKANGSDKFEDPRGGDYGIDASAVPKAMSYTDGANKVGYRPGQQCDEGTDRTVAAAGRSFAVLVPLESGDVACQDNR